jgi:hypothetical protein
VIPTKELRMSMSAKSNDHRIYRSFEEFEREELRRLETLGASVDDMIDTLFGEELHFEAKEARRSRWDEEDE